MFRVLAKWQKQEAKMADFCGFADAHQVSDEPFFSPLINGLCAGELGVSATARQSERILPAASLRTTEADHD